MIIRKAKLSDVEQIYQLVSHYAEKGLMLPRARTMLYENIRDFVIAEIEGEVVGVGALHVLWADLAELRTLAVENSLLGQGVGRKISEFILNEAKDLEIQRVFTLTYQPGFFQKLGFSVIDKDAMPRKIWTDCINCPKFPDCSEVCLEIYVNK